MLKGSDDVILIYFLVAFGATTFGALAGLGGGVIIKPLLDTLGHYDLSTIGLLSSITVFSMAIVSIYKQSKNGFKANKNLILLALGSILGGGIGKSIFAFTLNFFPREDTLSGIQAILLGILLIIVFFKKHLPHFHVKNPILITFIGLILGTIASFLGIGGGPINVAVLVMFMALDIKDAAVNSIFIILLSQFSKLSLVLIGEGFAAYNLKMLYVMIPGGILGGLLGSKLNKVVNSETLHTVFNLAVLLIIFINFYNAYNFLI